MTARLVPGEVCMGAALAALALACFQPTYSDGIRCSEAHTCPPGLMCDLTADICRAAPVDAAPAIIEDAAPVDAAPVDAAPSTPVDAAPTDAAPDASVDAAPDACELAPGVCGPGMCIPGPDGYTCACDDGYEFDGTSCALITYGIVGPGTAAAPRAFADGSHAASCLGYRLPALPYLYQGDIGDGFYVIDIAGVGTTLFCDMTTDGGGWTRLVHWDRAADPAAHTVATLRAALVDEVAELGDPTITPMSRLADAATHVTWADVDATFDVLSFRRDIPVPNQGGVLLDVHYRGDSMEESSTWIHATVDGRAEDIRCWSDAEAATRYSASERALIPYPCPSGVAQGITFVWNSREQRAFAAPVTAVRLRSLHGDSDADRSELYRFILFVR